MSIENTIDFNFKSGEGIWFTSDTHFNHENIIRFCKRPFKDVKEMNEEIIKRWNSIVKPDDIVFHLGDFAWGGSEVWNNVLDRLNGRIVLIMGNHDEKNIRSGYYKRFEHVAYQMHIYVEGQSIYLNHYPFLCYAGTYRGEDATWQLFGHVHSGPNNTGLDVDRLTHLFPTQYDVGVDNNNYYPVSFHQVRDIIKEQQLSNGLSRK